MDKYLNVATGKIGHYNSVSEYVESTTLNVDSKYIKLSEEQQERALNSKDVSYIVTGVETPKTLNELKAEKLKSLSENYDAKINTGYTYNNWGYPISENTIKNIVEQETLIKIAERNNISIDSFQLTDGIGIDRTFTLEQYNEFALGYGTLTAQVKKAFATIRNSINNSENETELNGINTEI